MVDVVTSLRPIGTDTDQVQCEFARLGQRRRNPGTRCGYFEKRVNRVTNRVLYADDDRLQRTSMLQQVVVRCSAFEPPPLYCTGSKRRDFRILGMKMLNARGRYATEEP